MQKFKRMSKTNLTKLLSAHLLHYPAIRVVLKHLVDFPKDVYSINGEELEQNVKELVKGLIWKKGGKE